MAGAGYVAGSALAQGGTNTSAGDQQYIDPLTGTTSAPATTPSPSAGSSSQSASPAPSSTTSTPSSPSVIAPSAPAPSSSSSHASGDALPFTGLDVGTLVIVGAALLGAGVLLRFALRRA